MESGRRRAEIALPSKLNSLFWDCDPQSLDIARDRSFIIRRILDRGDWEAMTWLRQEVGDSTIKEWLLQKRGGGLNPRALNFWGLILRIPKKTTDEWVQTARKTTWHARTSQ